MKQRNTILCTLVLGVSLFFSGCNSSVENRSRKLIDAMDTISTHDYSEITNEGVLKAITIFSPTSYFLYRGQTMGFEYELLQKLVADLGLNLEIVVAENLDKLFDMLNHGEGDLIAYGLTITEPRKDLVSFTLPLYETNQVLVQRKPANWRKMKLHEIDEQIITNPIDLIGKKVYVRKNSSYYQRLLNLSQEIGGEILIDTVSGNLTTDELIEMVVNGEIDYTVADQNLASINATYYPILDVRTAISFPQRIAWATRKNSRELLSKVNGWIEESKGKTEYNVIYNKYFKNEKLFRTRVGSEYYSKKSGRISKYDDLVREYARQLGWDWRLLSAMIYQESRFDPRASSWAGGKGLMQLLPATAGEVGVKNLTNPEDNIRGGTKYLKNLWDKWTAIPDTVQRIKFTLASYNCGIYHVRDAQRLSAKNGGDTTRWDLAVEDYILKLTYPKFYSDEVVHYGYVRGIEPYGYVREIFDRYDEYCRFIDAGE